MHSWSKVAWTPVLKKKKITLPLLKKPSRMSLPKKPLVLFFLLPLLQLDELSVHPVLRPPPSPPPATLLMPEIHFDKDAGWCRQRNPRLAYRLSTWKKLQQLRFSCRAGGGRQKPEMLSPSLLSLIRCFQTLLLMFVLCYSLTREKKNEMLTGSKIFYYTETSKLMMGTSSFFPPTSCLYHLNV